MARDVTVSRSKRTYPRAGRWRPSLWAGWIPNGVGQVKPNHYVEMLRTMWANKRRPLFAARILRKGVCDGCALGTSGLHDRTMKGVHLCTVRLDLLKYNTMGPLDPDLLSNVSRLKDHSTKQLRDLGRLPYPMMRRPGMPGFVRVTWDEALGEVAKHIRVTTPSRMAFFFTSRGLTNENYYVGQKVARFLGTNNVDNSSRICHAPSTSGMKATLGVAASTCSYKDWIESDLIVFFGSDTPNNQPVTTKYLYYAKKAGAKVFVVNPFREPGLERYWVPSSLESAIFGTRITDEFFEVDTGGDIAFITGVAKRLFETNAVDHDFVNRHGADLEPWRRRVESTSWDAIEQASGATRQAMQRFADEYAKTSKAVFVWSMGLTQHVFGVDNVKAVCNLALLRANVGRDGAGLMPIRGHSGVQGGAEMGCVPNQLPGGDALDEGSADTWTQHWGFPVPTEPGLTAVDFIDASHRGDLDVLWSVGGNWLETLPEPEYVREALRRVKVRVHQDIFLTPQMLEDANEVVVLLPATTRYEQPGGGTETSTERMVYFSPEIKGRRIGQARTEWDVLTHLARLVDPENAHRVQFKNAQKIREEIARHIPSYRGIQNLRKAGDAFQWGGRHLCQGGAFATPDARAHFADVCLPEREVPPGAFLLSTRRGKQFNSMVHRKRDPLTGAHRDHVLMNEADAQFLGVREADAVTLRSDVGTLRARVKIAPIRRGNLQVHWPEGNVLLPRGRTDPTCGIPDYNTIVHVEPVTVDSVRVAA